MAKEVEREFKECVEREKIKKFESAARLVEKELAVAEKDLVVAKKGLNDEQWKWSTIQAYYSMFHTARALLFSAGYREKSHYCLRVAIEVLFVHSGKVPAKYIDAFQLAKEMRENADYSEDFSESGARKLVVIAEEFVQVSRNVLK